MTPSIPVLMYHAVSAHPAPATATLSVRPAEFAAQLALLRRDGFTPLRFADLGAALRGASALPERPVVLTFDDGYADFHREALPLLRGHGWPATVFVTTGWVADAAADAAGMPLDRMLTWSQIGEAAAAGIEIGAHSHSHPQLDQLPDAARRIELTTSRGLLEDRLGREVRSLAYPFGYSSARVRASVRDAGYRQAAAVANVVVAPGADLLALPRLTVRRSTDLATFRRMVHGEGIGRIFAVDRALTAGWAAVRRSRYVVAKVRGHV